MEGVQRVVLAASRPESVGEPEEVLLVDGLGNRRDRLLDDSVCEPSVRVRLNGCAR
jgi:hypothetical protein